MAHELAHHWFGNTSVAWWNDHWLKESLADFAALKVLAAKKPNHPWRAIMFSKSRVMSLDARGKVGALRAPVETPAKRA